MMIRLDKYLADMDIGTRSEVKEYIKKNRIKVNGKLVNDSGLKVSEEDEVLFDDEPVIYEELRYYMLNKPAGVVSATEDNDTTVIDLLIGENTKGLFPVGRLDKDTTGLLLITNDGKLSHNLLSPRKHVEKCYYVETLERLTKEMIKDLCEGVDIGDDTMTKSAKVDAISPKSMYLTITEGRYHQVKRMLEAVGNKVIKLKRVSFGSLSLDDSLAPGEFRRLDDIEIMMLSANKSGDFNE